MKFIVIIMTLFASVRQINLMAMRKNTLPFALANGLIDIITGKYLAMLNKLLRITKKQVFRTTLMFIMRNSKNLSDNNITRLSLH